MEITDLQKVVAEIFKNPDVLNNGVKSGAYSCSLGKIWRGNIVIGYCAKAPIQGEQPVLMHTSQTSPQEAACLKATAPAEPTEAPPMELNSPEGKASEDPAPSAGQISPTDPNSPGGEKPPGSEQPPQGEQPPPLQQHKVRRESRDPSTLLQQNGTVLYPAEFEALNESRMIETRRKYIKIVALLEFDIESKRITGGEWIHLYLLPANRSEGKYELYDYCVTRDAGIPSAFRVTQEVSAAVREAVPHIVPNQGQLVRLGRKMHAIMRAAKDVLGGPATESLVSELESYLVESV